MTNPPLEVALAVHVFTLVITPGPRRSAIRRAERLLREALPSSYDYGRPGGRFSDRLGSIQRPELEEWYRHEAEQNRRLMFDTDLDDAEFAKSLGLARENDDEKAYRAHIDRLKRDEQLDLVRLTSDLPSPLPLEFVPAAMVTPEPRWQERPASWAQGDSRWSGWVNRTIDSYRGGHCVVAADCHL